MKHLSNKTINGSNVEISLRFVYLHLWSNIFDLLWTVRVNIQ